MVLNKFRPLRFILKQLSASFYCVVTESRYGVRILDLIHCNRWVECWCQLRKQLKGKAFETVREGRGNFAVIDWSRKCVWFQFIFCVIFFVVGRIDSVFVYNCGNWCMRVKTPNSSRDCPCVTYTYLCLLILARTSKLKVRRLTNHREETSILLLSPLLYIFENIMVAAYLTIPTSTQP